MFPDAVCVSVWEMWQVSTRYRQYKKFHILISYFNVLPVSFIMSITERTYIMIKVRCGAQKVHRIADKYNFLA